jgi:hypothetical protein
VLSALSDVRSSLSDLQKRVEISTRSSAVRDRFEEVVGANLNRVASDDPLTGESYWIYMTPGTGKTQTNFDRLIQLREIAENERRKSKKSDNNASGGESSESKKTKD